MRRSLLIAVFIGFFLAFAIGEVLADDDPFRGLSQEELYVQVKNCMTHQQWWAAGYRMMVLLLRVQKGKAPRKARASYFKWVDRFEKDHAYIPHISWYRDEFLYGMKAAVGIKCDP